CQQYNSFPLTC
nr:immunoglobulin light chain junction region [Macaca mulatta]